MQSELYGTHWEKFGKFANSLRDFWINIPKTDGLYVTWRIIDEAVTSYIGNDDYDGDEDLEFVMRDRVGRFGDVLFGEYEFVNGILPILVLNKLGVSLYRNDQFHKPGTRDMYFGGHDGYTILRRDDISSYQIPTERIRKSGEVQSSYQDSDQLVVPLNDMEKRAQDDYISKYGPNQWDERSAQHKRLNPRGKPFHNSSTLPDSFKQLIKQAHDKRNSSRRSCQSREALLLEKVAKLQESIDSLQLAHGNEFQIETLIKRLDYIQETVDLVGSSISSTNENITDGFVTMIGLQTSRSS
jgi:hypothetical protein